MERSLWREEAARMNTHSLQRDTNRVTHEAACRRLLESFDADLLVVRSIQMDLKGTLEAMAAVARAHVEYVQAIKSLVASPENSAGMREIKVLHSQATHRAGDVLPAPPNLATRKDKLVSREKVLNTLIKA